MPWTASELPAAERAFLTELQDRALRYFLDNQTPEGLVLVDSGLEDDAGPLKAQIAQLGLDWRGIRAILLTHAERTRGELNADRLRYSQHDLRHPLSETGFDVAMNVFSSIGYSTEEDDLAVFRTLRAAVRPGGLVFVETMHRDLAVRATARGARGERRADGTLVVETSRFDGLMGRSEPTWYWAGPRGSGQKSASLRIYSATELLRLVESVGLRFVSAHKGCSLEPFSPFEGRLGLLFQAS